jgi:hypothetical protein
MNYVIGMENIKHKLYMVALDCGKAPSVLTYHHMCGKIPKPKDGGYTTEQRAEIIAYFQSRKSYAKLNKKAGK